MATSVSVEVDRPAPEVFDYVTDPSRFSEWQNGVVDGHRLAEGPGSTGGPTTDVSDIVEGRFVEIAAGTRVVQEAARTETGAIETLTPPNG
ncbi:SRPBCC family protein [Acidiferrimicrobium sp. IK]|uniref:SRPBCC family protein n=1 Tax=Acidiferrimicrobium sp. IK TaxID=2871700 RepID=UPI0021CB06AB|nr:SRPBCC family protein [Acidiferrimicrobium sp. IK]MCU4187192.1 SRPBCC family protein [Acidiferrimicrobium sp. IK]